MKKYLLTAFLGLFGFIGAFTSAETLDGFTSSSEVCKYKNNTSFSQVSILDIYSSDSSPCHGIVDGDNNSLVYVCVSTNDTPYYMQSWGYSTEDFVPVNNSNYCFAGTFDGGSDSDIYFYTDTTSYESKTLNGSIYVSANPMTFSSSSAGGNTTEGGAIIQGGIDTFTPVISRMLEIAGEFIPYIVYIFIGYLGVILLWKAVKYILGYLKEKSERTFLENEERDYHNIKNAKDYNTRKIKYKRYEDTEDYETRDKRHKNR